jgi:5'-methylthioadenosine phosphorylase
VSATDTGAIGIIGGSGLYDLEGLEGREEVRLETPFGDPSDAFVRGTYRGAHLLFLPRHGRGHRLLPSEVPFRANVWGMRKLGATHVISASAVGSMKESIAPGDVVVVDQFVDRTDGRPRSFFGRGVVGHVAFADPVCPVLAGALAGAAEAVAAAGATGSGTAHARGRAGAGGGLRVHRGGAYLCIEGPQFSTRAESRVYRQWGVDVIGMTNLPEARLAREAELCYATLALVTDYDCWHESEEAVSVEMVIETLSKNVAAARRVVAEAVSRVPRRRECGCPSALRHAVMTDRARIPAETRRDLALFLDPYLGQS